MFYTYGPHSPTAYGNGPTIVEPQSEWILETMKMMERDGKTKINAQKQAEQHWKKTVNDIHAATLRDRVDSWYMGMSSHSIRVQHCCRLTADTGSNIPGKPRQALNYAGGVPLYIRSITEKLQNNWEGFDLS
jgi:hypothetical protein